MYNNNWCITQENYKLFFPISIWEIDPILRWEKSFFFFFVVDYIYISIFIRIHYLCSIIVVRVWRSYCFLFVGEEDARVLTLAERIIAALPERIKKDQCDHQPPTSPSPAPPLSELEDALMEQMVSSRSIFFE